MTKDLEERREVIRLARPVRRWQRWLTIVLTGDPLIEISSVKRVDATEIRKVLVVYLLTIPTQVVLIFAYGWLGHPHPASSTPRSSEPTKIIQP